MTNQDDLPSLKRTLSNSSGHDVPPPAKRINNGYYLECSMCCEEVYCNRFPRKPHANATVDCKTCFKCWGNHINRELELKDWDKLGCAQCGELLTPKERDRIVGVVKGTRQINAT